MSRPLRPNALDRLAGAWTRFTDPATMLGIAGRVRGTTAGLCRVAGLSTLATLGQRVATAADGRTLGEIIAIDPQEVVVLLHEPAPFLRSGDMVLLAAAETIAPMRAWRGRVLDAFGRPLDGLPDPPAGARTYALDAAPPPSLARARLGRPFATGVRAIDIFCPMVEGQRIGIFAGSGVGKSTLLGMLAAAAAFDTVVVALVGERGREVREIIEGPLAGARERAVFVVSTADESAARRRRAPHTAMAIAESFRDAGDHVLLIVDSITRYAHAAREVGLAAGETPVARGYPPSVFGALPRLLERAGPGMEGTGTITAVHAVLVDGDDHNEPVADAVRGTLDGHLVLDRGIADEGRFPAIDVLRSLSRLAPLVWTDDEAALARHLRLLLARHEETRDLRLLGGYRPGQEPLLDEAIRRVPRLQRLLVQTPGEAPAMTPFRDVADTVMTP